MKAALCLIGLLLLSGSAQLHAGDHVILKDGTDIECHILDKEDRPDTLVVNRSLLRGVVDRQEIPKATIGEIRRSDGKEDPAYNLQLPPNSMPPEWYQDEIKGEIDPWLAIYPKSTEIPRMEALRQSFLAEAQRVTGGEIRRGDHWIPLQESEEWRPELEAEDLTAAIAKASDQRDAAALLGLLPKVAEYHRLAAYPALVRTALAAIANCSEIDTTTLFQDFQSQRAACINDQKRNADYISSMINQLPAGSDTLPMGYSESDCVRVGQTYYPRSSLGDYSEFKDYYVDSGPTAMTTNSMPAPVIHAALPDAVLEDLRNRLQQIKDDTTQIAAIDHRISDVPGAVGQIRSQFTQIHDQLANDPLNKKEQVLTDLKTVGSHIDALDWSATKSSLDRIRTAWPENYPTARLLLDKDTALVASIEDDIAQRKIEAAIGKIDFATKLNGAVNPSFPRKDALQASLKELPAKAAQSLKAYLQDIFDHQPYETFLAARISTRATLTQITLNPTVLNLTQQELNDLDKQCYVNQAIDLQKAFNHQAWDTVMDFNVDAAPASVKQWCDPLRQKALDSMHASQADLDTVNGLLLHLNIGGANHAIASATEKWHTNPDIDSKQRTVSFTLGGLIGGAIFIVVVVGLTFWNTTSYFGDMIRHRIARKKFAKK